MRAPAVCLLGGLIAAAVLAGCMQPAARPQPSPPPAQAAQPEAAPVPETAPAPAPPARVSDTERLLYYYEYLLGLPPEQVAREAERTQRFFGQHRSEFALMQLVLLKMLPGATTKERSQAADTLGQYLKDTRDRGADLRPFALLLDNLLVDQLKSEAEAQAQAQRLKDEAKRYDELKQKLDALIETERKMLERSKPTRNK